MVERTDGETVLYVGKLNWIFGLPGSGKSWLGIIAIHEAVLKGGNVLYLDFEDTPATFQRRAALIGFIPATYADSFRYITQGMADVPTAVAEAQQWLADAPSPEFSLVVIDADESSGCPSDGSDVNPWIRKMVEPWRSTGAGVLRVDHQPKRSEGRPDGPIGSQRKLAAVEGAALAISGMPWTKRKGGKIILTNHKDRGGDLTAPKHQAAAVIVGTWSGEGDARAFGYSIEVPEAQENAEDMGMAILAGIADAGPDGIMGKRAMRDLVSGKNGAKDATIQGLIDAGLVIKSRMGKADNYALTADGLAMLEGL